MIDILWSFFELIVTVFEEFVIVHFICKFLGHNFSTLKGKVIYVSGSLVGSVVVSVVDHMVNYESWLGAVYMAYWFIFALLFLDGKILNKSFFCAIGKYGCYILKYIDTQFSFSYT